MSADQVRGGPQHIPRPPGTTLGDPAPWADLPAEDRRPSIADIRAAMARARPPAISPVERAGARSSAVLAPLYHHDDEVWIVLTRRSWMLRSHTGEVSFPGGRQEPGEDLWATAIRETEEEIGLHPDLVEPVGELDHLATVSSGSAIIPFVGILAGGRPELVPAEAEVDAILHVPLSELLEPENYRQERWRIAGTERPIHFFELVGDTVWGATGSMLVDLLRRITDRAHAPKPDGTFLRRRRPSDQPR